MIYACSDIHGQFHMFKRMLKKVQFSENDELYIIGDVIDRGPQPISLLLYIREHPNMHLLIGNHEDLMIRAQKDPIAAGNWYLNGGEVTDDQLMLIGKMVSDGLIEWVSEQTLFIPNLQVNGRSFFLAHAAHPRYYTMEPLHYKDAGAANIHHVTWSREFRNPDPKILGIVYKELYARYPKTILLSGHTPVQACRKGHVTADGFGRFTRAMNGHFINLDCGCAKGRTLGFLCLDTMKEYYVDRREKDV